MPNITPSVVVHDICLISSWKAPIVYFTKVKQPDCFLLIFNSNHVTSRSIKNEVKAWWLILACP